MDPFHARIMTDRPMSERLDMAHAWIKETKDTGVCSVCSHPMRAATARLHIFKHLDIRKQSLHAEPLKLMASVDLEALLESVPASAATAAPAPAPVTPPASHRAKPAAPRPKQKGRTRDDIQDRTCPVCHIRFANVASMKAHAVKHTVTKTLDPLNVLQYIRCREWSTLSLQTGHCLVCNVAVTQPTSLLHMLCHVNMTSEQFRNCHTSVDKGVGMVFKTVELPVTVVSRLSAPAVGGVVTLAAVLEALQKPVPRVAAEIAAYDRPPLEAAEPEVIYISD